MCELTRRGFLLGAGGAMAATAGCLGGPTAARDGGGVQASFFVVSDLAANVAGDAMPVETLVPFGQHGHGWEPGPSVQRAVASADAFVYVGEGFQPWADKIVRNLRSDGADVPVIEAWANIELRSGNHEEHDHGASDPHFWLDTERAGQAVENVDNGLAAADPANADAYAANAAAYTDRLAALDAAYRKRLADRTGDTVLVAGHNSFQYLAERYGFHVEALTGIAPDASPTPSDIARAQTAIDEHAVEYILAPVFESDRAARQLVAETDARAVLPLTPVPTLTEEWRENGWGYLEVMAEVNLPSLARALGAE